MAWVKVESSVSRNRKFVKAGPAPAWLWLCGLAYCQEGLTDGFIPHESLDFLGVKNAKGLAARLVDARLWDVVPGGWRIHDYLEHNKTAAEVRRTTKARAEGGKDGGRPPKNNLPGNLQGLEGETLEVNLPENHSGNPALTAPTAEAPTAPARRRAPLHDTSHRNHAQCGRICLHASLFGEFVRRRGHANAEREVSDWASAVAKDWVEGGAHAHDEPGDPFDFWRARYEERWPAKQSGPAATDRTQDLLSQQAKERYGRRPA